MRSESAFYTESSLLYDSTYPPLAKGITTLYTHGSIVLEFLYRGDFAFLVSAFMASFWPHSFGQSKVCAAGGTSVHPSWGRAHGQRDRRKANQPAAPIVTVRSVG